MAKLSLRLPSGSWSKYDTSAVRSKFPTRILPSKRISHSPVWRTSTRTARPPSANVSIDILPKTTHSARPIRGQAVSGPSIRPVRVRARAREPPPHIVTIPQARQSSQRSFRVNSRRRPSGSEYRQMSARGRSIIFPQSAERSRLMSVTGKTSPFATTLRSIIPLGSPSEPVARYTGSRRGAW